MTLSRSWHSTQINRCSSTMLVSDSGSVPIVYCSKGAASSYHVSFPPIVITRCWEATVLVTCPKRLLVGVVFGAANCGWFSASEASPRNWKLTLSVIRKPLNRPTSQLSTPSARTPDKLNGKVRRLKESCWLEVRLKPAPVLNHRDNERCEEERGML